MIYGFVSYDTIRSYRLIFFAKDMRQSLMVTYETIFMLVCSLRSSVSPPVISELIMCSQWAGSVVCTMCLLQLCKLTTWANLACCCWKATGNLNGGYIFRNVCRDSTLLPTISIHLMLDCQKETRHIQLYLYRF